jgi:hypothetical protein
MSGLDLPLIAECVGKSRSIPLPASLQVGFILRTGSGAEKRHHGEDGFERIESGRTLFCCGVLRGRHTGDDSHTMGSP